MSGSRTPNAGVTLIEMLLALAVSAMIGLAGFVLLESTLRTQAGVSGELERLAQIQKAFRLFTLDSQNALSARFRDPETLAFHHYDVVAVWLVSDQSVQRRLEFFDRDPVTQVLLEEASVLEETGAWGVTLHLPNAKLWRLAARPNTP